MTRLSILSNVNVDIIRSYLDKKFDIYLPYGYNAWFSEVLDESSGLIKFSPEVIVVLIDVNAALDKCSSDSGRYSVINELLSEINVVVQKFQSCLVLVNTIDVVNRQIKPIGMIDIGKVLEAKWNARLQRLSKEHQNVRILDLKSSIEGIGRRKFYDLKMWYLGNIPYSIVGFTEIANEIELLWRAYFAQRKKCLVIDLDNTIWGGVVGEDGYQNIILSESKEGARYRDIQKRIKELKDLGILIAVISKNNQEDVRQVFSKNKYMVLKLKDFVAVKANWVEKAKNLGELANELNLNPDSFVFLDDNIVEQEQMASIFPDVAIIRIDGSSFYSERTLIDAYKKYFPTLTVTKEDRERTEQYKNNRKRNELVLNSINIGDYLSKLRIELSIGLASQSDFERISQLTQKTNQFNLTTRRYTVAMIDNIANDSSHLVFIGRVRDRYGDEGLVWVCIIERNGDSAIFDSVLMSCRVMGRKIENAAMAYIEGYCKKIGIKMLHGEYLKTSKNAPVEDFFEKFDYRIVQEDEKGNKQYEKELTFTLPFPKEIKLVEL